MFFMFTHVWKVIFQRPRISNFIKSLQIILLRVARDKITQWDFFKTIFNHCVIEQAVSNQQSF